MSDVTATVDAYLDGLTQTDAARRAELIRKAWADDGRFVDRCSTSRDTMRSTSSLRA
jgi:hypothetical protein